MNVDNLRKTLIQKFDSLLDCAPLKKIAKNKLNYKTLINKAWKGLINI